MEMAIKQSTGSLSVWQVTIEHGTMEYATREWSIAVFTHVKPDQPVRIN